ncbi:MAG: sulfurtransferase-like selenium metabolism protein YedF [Bacteroidales bacterium]|nr:sulfurtransferase-like selenium metabolism protein YedF [Bacteroidales bacterium]
MNNSKNTLIQITNYGMGQGDESLGLKLATNYFNLLLEDKRLPKIIVFYNGGVKLLSKSAPTAEILLRIEQEGVKLLACKTCIDFYEISETLKAGTTGSMMDIITLQATADKVITL